MKDYAKIYSIYTSALIKAMRVLVFLLLLAVSFYTYFINPVFLKIPVFFLGVFLIQEIFFRFHVYRKKPEQKVIENNGSNIYSSFTLNALRTLNSKGIDFNKIFNEKPVRFILEKAEIKKEEITKTGIKLDDITKYAFELVKAEKGEYVTATDLFVSYLLLSEDSTKLLFNKKIKKENLMAILFWARRKYGSFEKFKKPKAEFFGQGIAEDWVYGWTIETKKYMLDQTDTILTLTTNFYDREVEYQRVIEALSANKNVILVGDPGVGKKSLLYKFGYDSIAGKLKGNIYHQRLFQLMVDAFLAGAQNQGELEERLQSIIAELSHAGNIIIYIEDFENILGSSSFKLDLSAALIPYLEKGVIRIVATSSNGSFKKFIEPLHELLKVFEVIKMEEPKEEIALPMIFEKLNEIEDRKKIAITYKAVISALEYAKRYSKNLVLPGAAISLLEDSLNSCFLKGQGSVTEENVLCEIEKEISSKVGEPKAEEKEELLHLEEEIHQRVIGQNEAVSAVSQALRRLRSGLTDQKKPISFLFLGPTGVGKTETAKALADAYYEGERNMIRFDMSEFSGDDAVGRLIGPEGLADKIYQNPSSLILLDEFEKANHDVLNLFLQVLDDGRLTDNNGRTVSFMNSIIIATSNAASEFIREEVGKGAVIDKAFQTRLFEFLQTKGILKPELLNRFDEVITFKPLGQNELSSIINLLLQELKRKTLEKDINLVFSDQSVIKIAKEGFDQQFGARPLRRFIQDNIEDILAQKLLKDEIKRGDKILVTIAPNGNFSFIPSIEHPSSISHISS